MPGSRRREGHAGLSGACLGDGCRSCGRVLVRRQERRMRAVPLAALGSCFRRRTMIWRIISGAPALAGAPRVPQFGVSSTVVGAAPSGIALAPRSAVPLPIVYCRPPWIVVSTETRATGVAAVAGSSVSVIRPLVGV